MANFFKTLAMLAIVSFTTAGILPAVFLWRGQGVQVRMWTKDDQPAAEKVNLNLTVIEGRLTCQELPAAYVQPCIPSPVHPKKVAAKTMTDENGRYRLVTNIQGNFTVRVRHQCPIPGMHPYDCPVPYYETTVHLNNSRKIVQVSMELSKQAAITKRGCM